MLLLLAGLAIGAARAQDAPTASTLPPEITQAALDARLKGIPDNASLDDAAKTQLTQLYTQSLEQLKIADDWRGKADQFEQLRTSAPEQLKVQQQELDAAPGSAGTDPAAELAALDALPLPDLEIKVSEMENALLKAQSDLSDLEQEPTRRTDRRRQIPALQADARTRLDAAKTQLATAAAATEIPEIAEARRVLGQIKVQLVEQELRCYTEEMNSYDARGRLLALRLDLATRNAQRTKDLVDSLHDILAAKRDEDARQAEATAREALLEATNAPIQIRDLVKQLAADNAQLTSERTGPDGFLQKLNGADAEIKDVTAKLVQLDSDFNAMKKRVDAGGSSTVIGLLLQSHRRELPDIQEIQKKIAQRKDEIARIQIEQIDIETTRRSLANIDDEVAAIVNGLPDDLSDAQKKTIRDLLLQFYQTKQKLMRDKTADYESYFDKLIDLDAIQSRLIEKTREFDNYISERVLWVRSGTPLGLAHLKDAEDAFRWLRDPNHVGDLLDAIRYDAVTNPSQVALAFFSLLLLFAARHPLRKRLGAHAQQARKRGNIQIGPTMRAAADTFILSLDVPLLLGLAGWRLSESLAGTAYTSAVGTGLLDTAMVLWSLDFAREVLKRNALGVAHFDWSDKACRSIYRTLLWLEILALPLVFVIFTLAAQDENAWSESLGRLCFMAAMMLATVALHRLLRRRKGALFDLVELARGKSSLYMRRIGYVSGVTAPVALFIAAGLGYYYSALHIGIQIHATIMCTFCLVLAVQLTLKWMILTRKVLAREQARKRLEALRESAASESEVTVEKEHEIDLARIDAQTMRLIRSAFVIGLAFASYFIWSRDLPALNALDQVQIGTTMVTVQQQIPDPDTGLMKLQPEEVAVPITLRNVALFLFIVAFSFIAVQNLPGLIEIILLQRLSLIAGERYAINSIIGYVLTLIGATWALTTVGLSWSKVQWLVAAVGLGLGFGLQEIFANLVSGIIILFERPIRVGDTVTVGDISGTVSRIRIRATWITAFNRQELIVPNKEFVTGRLVNWTLSDQVLRVEIPVGIAYGSDTALARKLMLDVANEHTLVLADPKPVVYFLGFGDSSLDFELRVHSPDLESYLPIKDAMHTGIDEAFRANGIEIPFPQRDVHVRSIESALRVENPGKLPPG